MHFINLSKIKKLDINISGFDTFYKSLNTKKYKLFTQIGMRGGARECNDYLLPLPLPPI